MKLPPPLQKGDTIALASPARFVKPAEVEYFVRFATQNGWKVRLDEACFARHNQFGGSDEQRAAHLQALIDDPEIKAIICSRGGYGSLRILDKLRFETMLQRPKWLVGFSDITVLHAKLQSLGIASLHAPMPFNFGPDDQDKFEIVRQFLEGKRPPTLLPHHPLNISGRASGELTGGNLSIIYALKGSDALPDLNGKILFIEDVDEYLYHLDRMMLSLKRAGVFKGLAGIIAGAFTEIKDNAIPFGLTAEEIIHEHLAGYGFPLCFGFPAGHISRQQPLLLGSQAALEVTERGSFLSYF